MDLLTVEIDHIEGKVVNDLNKVAQELEGLKDRFNAVIQPLKDGGWIGEGANAFYQVVDGEILKGVSEIAQHISLLGSSLKGALEIIKMAEVAGLVGADHFWEAVDAIQNFENL